MTAIAPTTPPAPVVVPRLVLENLDLFACPACGGKLSIFAEDASLCCDGCARGFSCEEGIPRLYWPNEWSDTTDVTDVVKAFYEGTPFPNYDDLDSTESLRAKAESGVFARLLNEQISHGARVLECGCGTGQLSNFLGLTWGRAVFGTDLCVNSLRLGQAFRGANQIPSVCFLQMNLFRPAFRRDTFDVVISNGVLHHTSDAYRGFRTLLACLKQGGFIIIGLYNRCGRLTTDLRRLVFRLTGDRFTSIDPRLRVTTLGPTRKRAWFMDQYKHPHESKHTIDEVLAWFDQCGVEFITATPKCRPCDSFSPRERLFEPHPRGTKLDHFLVQLGMLLSGGREGGFFIMIGRKAG